VVNIKANLKDRKNIIIVLLCVLLFFSSIYIGWTIHEKREAAKLNRAFTQGYNTALVDTVSQLYTRTEGCQVTTINLGNLTRAIADVECLSKAMNEAQRSHSAVEEGK